MPDSQKGISILFAVAILSVVLSIALETSSILIRQVKMVREIDYSVVAFYAADNGIEEVLIMAIPQSIPETPLPGLSAATYEVLVKDSDDPDCNAPNYCITSIGTYRKTRRAIGVEF